MTRQERLQRLYQRALEQLGSVDDEFRQRLYEDLRLQVEYPNEYVAYADQWVEPGRGQPRRLDRQVLAHGSDMEQVLQAVRQQGNADDQPWLMDYFRDTESGTVLL
jgi:hypothetical protein